MSSTLEEERRALLEQIEASRAVYRRMLGGESSRFTATRFSPAITRQATDKPALAADFPRSHTMRWLIAYRWQLAIGATAAIILLGPGRKLANSSNVTKLRNKVRALPRTGVAQAVIGTGVSLLRSPIGLGMSGRIAGFLLRWMQQRRMQSSS